MQEAPRRSGGGFAAHDDGGRVAQLLGSEALPEPCRQGALERPGQLPGRQVQHRDHDRQVGRNRQRSATDRVIHGTGRATALRPPSRTERGAAQQERIDGHGSRAEEAGRRQQPAPNDLEVAVTAGRVVEIRAQEEGKRFALDRLGVIGAQEAIQVDRGQWRPLRRLERPGIQDDPEAGRGGDHPGPQAPRGRFGHGVRRPTSRSRNSSARSWMTTTSASPTIRRLILDWPTRRSRNVIGSSRTRAPARLARKVISIWKT